MLQQLVYTLALHPHYLQGETELLKIIFYYMKDTMTLNNLRIRPAGIYWSLSDPQIPDQLKTEFK